MRGQIAAFFAGVILSGGLLSLVPTAAHSGENRSLEIHEACLKAKLPVDTVRKSGDRYDVILRPNATPAEKAEAEAIKTQILSAKAAGPCQVTTVEDALVVLRYERNPAAEALLKKRYEELKKSQGQ